jgi:hypothetical protein
MVAKGLPSLDIRQLWEIVRAHRPVRTQLFQDGILLSFPGVDFCNGPGLSPRTDF